MPSRIMYIGSVSSFSGVLNDTRTESTRKYKKYMRNAMQEEVNVVSPPGMRNRSEIASESYDPLDLPQPPPNCYINLPQRVFDRVSQGSTSIGVAQSLDFVNSTENRAIFGHRSKCEVLEIGATKMSKDSFQV